MRVVNLGRPARFLIPAYKVHDSKHSKTGQNIPQAIHDFLMQAFGGYNFSLGNKVGFFRGQKSLVECDESKEFCVAFKEDDKKTRVPQLQQFLASICEDINEECIYLECGEDSMFVYPDKPSSRVEVEDNV